MKKSFTTAIVIGLMVVGSFLMHSSCYAQLVQLSEFLEKVEQGEIDHAKEPHTYFESKEQFVEMLESGIGILDEGHERDVCLSLLTIRYQKESREILKRLARDPSGKLGARLAALHVLALNRDPILLPLFKSLLDAPNVQIRIAAMEGFGWLMERDSGRFRRAAIRRLPFHQNWMHSSLDRRPTQGKSAKKKKSGVRSFNDDVKLKEKLLLRMTTAGSSAERRAAARAIVNWDAEAPRLRVAEWGVWISNADNKLQLAKSIVDEIPDFVFRTPNLVDELEESRLNEIMTITKPVLHFTTEVSMAIDLSVDVIGGQAWFSYPKPSDFHIATRVKYLRDSDGVQSLQLKPHESSLTGETDSEAYWLRFNRFSIEDAQSPYPWFKVKSIFGSSSGGMGSRGNVIDGVGFSWFNLQISPTMPTTWQAPVTVDEGFEWWSDLRTVDSSWINNGQQTERFLYYDGPTISKSPVTVDKTDSKLSVSWQFEENVHTRWQESPFADPCQAMLLQVKNGRFRSTLQHGEHQVEFNVLEDTWLDEQETIDALYQMLTSRGGLTHNEASGLVQAWKTQFLETEGTRLLARINQGLYNTMCPIEIHPKPGELSRVGIVLFEFGKYGPDWSPEARAIDAKLVTSRMNRVADDKLVRTDARVRAVLLTKLAPKRIDLLERLEMKDNPEALRFLLDYLVGSRALTGLAGEPRIHDELERLSGNRDVRVELVNAFANFRRSWPSVDDHTRIEDLLDVAGQMVENGIDLPKETAQSLAILIAIQEEPVNGNATYLFGGLTSAIEPKISPLPVESNEHQILVSNMERCIKGELDCVANDAGVRARLLSSTGASKLLQTALERTNELAKTTARDDRRLGRTLLIGTWIAAYIDQDDVGRLTMMANEVQGNSAGRPSHIIRFCNEIKRHMSGSKQKK